MYSFQTCRKKSIKKRNRKHAKYKTYSKVAKIYKVTTDETMRLYQLEIFKYISLRNSRDPPKANMKTNLKYTFTLTYCTI